MLHLSRNRIAQLVNFGITLSAIIEPSVAASARPNRDNGVRANLVQDAAGSFAYGFAVPSGGGPLYQSLPLSPFGSNYGYYYNSVAETVDAAPPPLKPSSSNLYNQLPANVFARPSDLIQWAWHKGPAAVVAAPLLVPYKEQTLPDNDDDEVQNAAVEAADPLRPEVDQFRSEQKVKPIESGHPIVDGKPEQMERKEPKPFRITDVVRVRAERLEDQYR